MSEQQDLISKLKNHIKELESELERMSSPPLSFGTVLQDMGQGRVLVAGGRGGESIAQLPPEQAELLEKGKSIAPGTQLTFNAVGAIVDILEGIPLAGMEAIVKRIFDGPMMEIEGGMGGGAALIFKGMTAQCDVKPGDVVQLDKSGIVALRLVPKDRSAYSVETATGVNWSDIGGQDHAKQTLQEAIEGPIKHAKLWKAYGKRPLKGVLLSGPPGCVDGNAIVTLNRAGKGYKTTLRDLHDKFNDVPTQSRNNRTYRWDLSIPTFIRCLHEGELRLKQVVDVYDKGVRAVKCLTLADGKQLLLTPDHEVKTAKGFVRTDTLSIGDLVYTNGSYISTSDGYEYRCSGLKNHPRAKRKNNGGYELAQHILVAEAALNEVDFDTWLERIARNDLADAKFLEVDKEVHHKDGVRTNNIISNLELHTRSTHCKVDRRHKNIPLFIPKESAVISIKDAGEIHVYDVTVTDAHNFVANGIVVHNCGKTLLAKAAASAIRQAHGGDEAYTAFIYVKGPEVLNMWVGNTEGQIRALFARAREHKENYGYPAVIFIDEADAILGKRGSHHASVLSSTIVPTFLAEMDGMGDSGAFVLLATNRQDVLDPAVVREGRIDRKVSVDRPGLREAAQILSIHVRKTKVQGSVDELAGAAAADLFSDSHCLYRVGLKGKGVHAFYMRHLASGALLAGVVDMATSVAIKRDVEVGSSKPSGISVEDITEAVSAVVKANKHLNHDDALILFAEAHGAEIEGVQRMAA